MSKAEIQSYLNDIGRYPVLTKEAQILHCRRIQAWLKHENGRDQAPTRIRRLGQRSMQAMTETNLRLVVSVAKNYVNYGLEFNDLIQEGTLGLIRGLELYDPTRGYAVSTYAYWWIRQAITRALYTYSRTIRIPINTHELLVRIQRFINSRITASGQAPTVAEIATGTGLTESRVYHILLTNNVTSCASLDSICPNGDSPLGDLYACDRSESPEEFALSAETADIVRNALQVLNPTEEVVIRATFFEGRPLIDIATELGVTRSRASQIQHRGFERIRQLLATQGYVR